MPFLTLNSGLTIKVPTRGTTNWDSTMLSDTFQKISAHDHTGGGNGALIGAGALADDSINDLKLRLRNNEAFRARNFANSADVSILKLGTDDRVELNSFLHFTKSASLANNQAVVANITDLTLDTAKTTSAIIEYGILRQGTGNIAESGDLCVVYNGSSWELSRQHTGNAFIEITITGGGQFQYTSSDLAGHTDSTMYFNIKSLGV